MTLYTLLQEIGCSKIPKDCSPPTEKSTNRTRARKNR